MQHLDSIFGVFVPWGQFPPGAFPPSISSLRYSICMRSKQRHQPDFFIAEGVVPGYREFVDGAELSQPPADLDDFFPGVFQETVEIELQLRNLRRVDEDRNGLVPFAPAASSHGNEKR